MAGKKGIVEGALKVAAEAMSPQKTVKAYKLFRQKDGKLYPLFVDANEEVSVGEWLKAKAGEQTASGKVKSKLGELAYRPGWHAGDLPIATHIGARSHGNPKLPPDTRPTGQVWAEVEMADDVDWQKVANERARMTNKGVPDPKTAHITDQVPYGGYYRYKTNPNMTGNWMIGGDMRVNRVLTDDEVKAINEAAGVSDLPRREGYANKGSVVGKALKVIENLGLEMTPNGIRAYHGSPHEFDRFDISKLGTGEGQQAYGHGLYFAGKEDIARWYRDKLSGNKSGVQVGKENHPHWDSRSLSKAFSNMGYDHQTSAMASYLVGKSGGDPRVLNELIAGNEKLPTSVREAISAVNIPKPSGHMYEVGIDADPNRLLDWNDPLSKQPDDVRSAIMPFAEYRANVMNRARKQALDKGVDWRGRPYSEEKLEHYRTVVNPEDFTGEDIHKQLQVHFGAGTPNDKKLEASQYLTDQGVHGIKFLDASSRGQGIIEPTNNLVIPDDKRIQILRRYAEGGYVDDRDIESALMTARLM